MRYQEIEGNLITLALEGMFDVIAHGCNCQCKMGAGLAPQMAEAFGCDEFYKEIVSYKGYDEDGVDYEVTTNNKGNINKLGTIDYKLQYLWFNHPILKREDYKFKSFAMTHRSVGQEDVQELVVVNAYTQFMYGTNHADGVSKPLDYEALTLCLRKMNHIFKGKHIGLPLIGCHLAGGVWDYTKINKKTNEGINLYRRFSNNQLKDVKTIIQEELKDCDVTIVHFKK